MQTNLDVFRENCHYFDGSRAYRRENLETQYPPIQEIECKLNDGRVLNLFLKYNPWKLIDSNDEQIVYQHCVFCGDKRFEHKKFNQIRPGSGESTVLCKKNVCVEAWYDLVEQKPGRTKNFMYICNIGQLHLL